MDSQGFPLFQSIGPKAWSVTELTNQIRGLLEPPLKQVIVQGEVTNFRPAASGHLYFSLKDESSVISSAFFTRGYSKRLAFELQDGLEVVCHGKVTVYPPRGSYQLVVERIEPVGLGSLQLAFEQLKKKLLNEGLFEASRKKAIPLFPKRVVVLTSPTGAAIRDFLTVLKRRSPQIEVLVVPTLVQGDQAAAQICRAIEGVERFALGEVLVLTRGGGSLEDLWAFNDEQLARTLAACKLPTVSAIGHEVDFTISDFVADLRAPTPSAAAEMLSANWLRTSERIQELDQRLAQVMVREVSRWKQLLQQWAARLVSPKDQLRVQMQKLDELEMRMQRAMKVLLEHRSLRLQALGDRLDALSPLRILGRGFSILRREKSEEVLRDPQHALPGERLRATLEKGDLWVRVDSSPTS